MKRKIIAVVFGIAGFCSCNNNHENKNDTEYNLSEATRIVSTNGTVSEILCKVGLEKNIVATDVTSNYPESLNKLPKIGHSRNMSAEGILSFNPNIILGIEEQLNPDLIQQLKNSGKKLWLFKQEYSLEGTHQLIKSICDSLNKEDLSENIIKQIKQKIESIKPFMQKPKVLFIYARGSGTLMAAGNNTQMHKVIELAGCQNAASGFEDFKNLSAEILVENNPDVILMFSSGIESINGEEGLLNIPGIKATTAGRNKNFIYMDGQYLSGFGPRLGDAVLELNTKIHSMLQQQL